MGVIKWVVGSSRYGFENEVGEFRIVKVLDALVSDIINSTSHVFSRITLVPGLPSMLFHFPRMFSKNATVAPL